MARFPAPPSSKASCICLPAVITDESDGRNPGGFFWATSINGGIVRNSVIARATHAPMTRNGWRTISRPTPGRNLARAATPLGVLRLNISIRLHGAVGHDLLKRFLTANLQNYLIRGPLRGVGRTLRIPRSGGRSARLFGSLVEI